MFAAVQPDIQNMQAEAEIQRLTFRIAELTRDIHNCVCQDNGNANAQSNGDNNPAVLGRKDRHHNHQGDCPCCNAKLRAKDRKITSLKFQLQRIQPKFQANAQAWENLSAKGRESRKRKFTDIFKEVVSRFPEDIKRVKVCSENCFKNNLFCLFVLLTQ